MKRIIVILVQKSYYTILHNKYYVIFLVRNYENMVNFFNFLNPNPFSKALCSSFSLNLQFRSICLGLSLAVLGVIQFLDFI